MSLSVPKTSHLLDRDEEISNVSKWFVITIFIRQLECIGDKYRLIDFSEEYKLAATEVFCKIPISHYVSQTTRKLVVAVDKKDLAWYIPA